MGLAAASDFRPNLFDESLDKVELVRHNRGMTTTSTTAPRKTRPWKVCYVWSNGLSGTNNFRSEDDAILNAEHQRQRTGPNGETCIAKVEYKRTR